MSTNNKEFKVSVKEKACQTFMKVKDIAEKPNDFAASVFTSNILSKYLLFSQ